jgi:hypothetical protein
VGQDTEETGIRGKRRRGERIGAGVRRGVKEQKKKGEGRRGGEMEKEEWEGEQRRSIRENRRMKKRGRRWGWKIRRRRGDCEVGRGGGGEGKEKD